MDIHTIFFNVTIFYWQHFVRKYIYSYRTSVHSALSEIVAKIEAKVNKYVTFTETVFANGLFVQNGLQIKESYEQNAKKYYNAEPTNVNFAEQPQQALDTINKWGIERYRSWIYGVDVFI